MKINTQIICKITEQEVTANKYYMQRLFSLYTETENCEIICFDFFLDQLATYMGKRRQRSREAVKVKSKRRKIRKRETLLLNRSIPSTEESPSTSNIDQETLAAVSEDVAGNIYIILVLIRKSMSLHSGQIA